MRGLFALAFYIAVPAPSCLQGEFSFQRLPGSITSPPPSTPLPRSQIAPDPRDAGWRELNTAGGGCSSKVVSVVLSTMVAGGGAGPRGRSWAVRASAVPEVPGRRVGILGGFQEARSVPGLGSH